jgi:hypothetical protein
VSAEIAADLEEFTDGEPPCRVRAHVEDGVVEIDAVGVDAELVTQLVAELWCASQPVPSRSNWQLFTGRAGPMAEDAWITTTNGEDTPDDDERTTE